VASAHKIFVSRSALQKQIDHPTLYFDFIDHGYAWIFPGTHKVTAGICGLRSKNAKSVLAAFHDFLTAVHIDKSDYGRIFSYVLPYGSFLPAPVFRNILLVGDAAGFADPLLGEGIFFAQRSAELAAQAIVTSIHSDNPDERLRQHYLGLLHDHVYTELEYAGKIRNAIFTYLKHGEWYPLKILMSMFGDRTIKAVHGIRSYRWLRNRIPPS
jgi:flavin-dependent dehydrogenase